MSPELPLTLRLPAWFQGAASGLEELGEDGEEEEAVWRRMRGGGRRGGGLGAQPFPAGPQPSPGGRRESSLASPAGPGQGAPA